MMEMTDSTLAAIDIGTNSFHLIIVKMTGNGSFEIIDREKEVIRLGLGSSPDLQLITPDAINRAVETLQRFKLIAQSYDAPIRAVATSAVRESLNRDEFINTVYNETGIEIEVISGYEEARLIYLGILRAVPVFDKKVLCIDIGGGSTEFSISYRGNVLFAVSLKIGAVRLSQKFFPDYEITNGRTAKCISWVESEIYSVVKEIKKIGYEECIGTSGTIMSSALMIYARQNPDAGSSMILNNYKFSAQELQKTSANILRKQQLKDRLKIPGLDEKRADIIPAGLIILNTIFDKLGLKEITVSGYVLREGIVIDSIQKNNPLESSYLQDTRSHSIMHVLESFDVDKEHSCLVADLAVILFDRLRNLHKLPPECREYLYAASILHDVGYHISHSQHHKHSYYIIRNSELLGFNENEIEIIANVARYHRKSNPKPRHADYEKLTDRTKDIVNKLSAIIRIADSLDRTHQSLVKDVQIIETAKEVRLNILYENDFPEIELWNVERRKELFEEVFNRQLTISAEKLGQALD
jgi:exopolyphosphatase/guanosine-5'-triphosphate,3'-diphosphate pyrophosphatase